MPPTNELALARSNAAATREALHSIALALEALRRWTHDPKWDAGPAISACVAELEQACARIR